MSQENQPFRITGILKTDSLHLEKGEIDFKLNPVPIHKIGFGKKVGDNGMLLFAEYYYGLKQDKKIISMIKTKFEFRSIHQDIATISYLISRGVDLSLGMFALETQNKYGKPMPLNFLDENELNQYAMDALALLN